MRITLPKKHSGQIYIDQNLKRFNLLVCGRRWRKTSFAMAWLVRKIIAKPNRKFLWGSPTHDQNKIAIEEFVKATKLVPNYSKSYIVFPNRSVLFFRSLEKVNNARGFTISDCVIDEAAYCKEDAWTKVIRPTLIDSKGDAMLLTTPFGENWIKNIYDNPPPDMGVWNFSTYGVRIVDNELFREPHPYENSSLDMAEIESLFATMDSFSFRQEIMAEFLADNLAVFTNVDELCCLPVGEYEEHKDHHIVAGLDLAKTVDFTALSIFCADCGHELYCFRTKGDYTDQVSVLSSYLKAYDVQTLTYDNTGVGVAVGDMMRDKFECGIIPYTYTNDTKNDLITNLQLAFEKKTYKWLANKIWSDELKGFRRIRAGDKVKFAPERDSDHDDTVNARALALHSVKKASIFL